MSDKKYIMPLSDDYLPPSYDPERELLAALLARAINDLNDKENKTAAVKWFLGKAHKNCFSFEQCCEYLNLDQESLLKAINNHFKTKIKVRIKRRGYDTSK